MAKADLITEAEALGVQLTGEETVKDLEAAIEAAKAANPEGTAAQPEEVVTPKASTAPVETPDYSWANNRIKLNRALAYVRATAPHLKGKELEKAVKERYVALKGLVKGDTIAVGRKGGREVNLADDDGSQD